MPAPTDFIHRPPAARGRLLTALTALVLGVLYAGAFAPLHLWWIGLPALAAGLVLTAHMRSAGAAFLSGFFFALGAFASGLSWTVRSMHEFGRIPLPLALLGLLALAAVCALFWGAAAAAAAKLLPRPAPRVIGLAALTAFAEWLRGAGGIDFGWLTPALAALETPFAGLAPLGGTHLVNAALLTSLAAIGAAAIRRTGRSLLLLLIPVVFLTAGLWGCMHEWSHPDGKVQVRLVQADLPIVDGWTRPDTAGRIERAAEILRAPWPASSAPRVVLTPEGILSADVLRMPARARTALEAFLDAADAPVLFNGFRRDDSGRWFNTSFFVADGRISVTDKRKLVPFGEFVPAGFHWFVEAMGIPLSDLTPGAARQPNLAFGGVRAGVLICYENLDGEVLRSFWSDPEGGPGLLFVTANLGWFSPFVIDQHLDMTRLLARAAARPAASVNMSGRSAFIGPRGTILAAPLPEGEFVRSKVIDAYAGAPTPFIRFGDLPALILTAFFFAGALIASRRPLPKA